MATISGKIRCVVCDKEKATLRCGGCFEEYCYNHWNPHRQELNKKFEEIEINRDLFRQSLTQHIEQPNNDVLIEEINQWKEKSIEKIERTAEETRRRLIENTNEYFHQLEIKLIDLTNQLRQSREENDYNEISLRKFEQELNQLTKELNQGSNISIREDSTSFINQISLHIPHNFVSSITNGKDNKNNFENKEVLIIL